MTNRVFNSKQACYTYFSAKQKKKLNSVSFPAHKNVELITQHYFVFFDKGFNTAI